MDDGIWALLLGVGAVLLVYKLPLLWMRAAGGLLILATVVAIALQLLGVL